MSLRTALAVLLAGVAGSVAYALAAAFFVEAAQMQLAADPRFHLVGVFFAVPVPLLYRFVPGAAGAGVALLLLTLLPALASKLGGDAVLGWPVLLALTFIYALTALVVYRLVAGSRE
jgi:hypothetical protein